MAASPSLTVRELIGKYLAITAHRERSQKGRALAVCRLGLFVEAFGDRRVEELSPDDLELWILGQPQWKAANTRRNVNLIIQAAFNLAVLRRWIAYNPVRGVSLEKGKRGSPMPPEVFRKLLHAVKDPRAAPPFRRFMIALKFTGARPGELYGLQWPMIDWNRRCAVLDQHKTARVTGAPRTIVFNSVAWKLIEWIHRHQGSMSYLPRKGLTPAAPNTYVFLNSFGCPWSAATIGQRMARLRKKGLIPKDTRPYGLRHSFCTAAILANVNPMVVMNLAGHKRLETTLRYTHVAGNIDALRAGAEQAMRTPPSKNGQAGHGQEPPRPSPASGS
jgi:integrase